MSSHLSCTFNFPEGSTLMTLIGNWVITHTSPGTTNSRVRLSLRGETIDMVHPQPPSVGSSPCFSSPSLFCTPFFCIHLFWDVGLPSAHWRSEKHHPPTCHVNNYL